MTTMIDLSALRKISPWRAQEALTADDPALIPFLTYVGRAAYLAWVAEWQSLYRTLAVQIRADKVAWRAAGSEIPPQLRFDLFDARSLARTLLALRAAGKRDSWAKAQSQRNSEVGPD